MEANKITYNDAKKFKAALAKNYNTFEAWPFTIGDEIAITTNGLGAAYITHYFRKQVKLRPYAKVTCYLPVIGLATLLTDFFHSAVINASLLELKSCKTCTVLKGMAAQVTFGVAHPLLLAPIINFYMADRLLTYPVPSITRAPRFVFNIWRKMVIQNKKSFLILAGIQALVGAVITVEKENYLWKVMDYQTKS